MKILLIILVKNWWHTYQVDFVLVYPHNLIEYEPYMNFSKGIDTRQENGKTRI